MLHYPKGSRKQPPHGISVPGSAQCVPVGITFGHRKAFLGPDCLGLNLSLSQGILPGVAQRPELHIYPPVLGLNPPGAAGGVFLIDWARNDLKKSECFHGR